MHSHQYHVLKFGGTSMKTADAIKQVCKVISENPLAKVVVVSAVGGVTDKLVAFQNRSDLNSAEKIQEIIDIHTNIALNLRLSSEVILELKQEIEILKSFCQKPISTSDLDEILSLGERLSSLILFHYMHANHKLSGKLKLKWLDARKVIKTDVHFGKSNPQIAEIAKAAELYLNDIQDAVVYITQGFIGQTINTLQTTTLGRGGSDYSAALFAEALKASKLFIYTDVPGVFSIDPNMVSNARQIAQLTFQEMAEMANFGAKILHPATLAPCVRQKIPVMILSTFEPELGGTLVTIDDSSQEFSSSHRENVIHPLVRSITMRKNQVLVTVKSLNMLNAYGFLSNIFSILAKYKISVDLITTSEVSVALTIDGTSLGSHGINPFTNPELIEELQKFSDLTIEDNLTLIAVIGPTLTGPGIAQQVFAKLDDTNVRAICYGASASSIGILVAQDAAKQVATVMHKKLIENM